MKRRAFILASGALLIPGRPSLAASKSTIVAVSCSDYDLEAQCTDFIAGALRERGVRTVAPEAISVTIKERLSVQIQRWFGGASVSLAYVASIARTYGASRVLLVDAQLYSTSLPYGEFTVTSTRAACSYRCFDASTKAIIAAGTSTGNERGEDVDLSKSRALSSAALSLVRSVAPKLLSR